MGSEVLGTILPGKQKYTINHVSSLASMQGCSTYYVAVKDEHNAGCCPLMLPETITVAHHGLKGHIGKKNPEPTRGSRGYNEPSFPHTVIPHQSQSFCTAAAVPEPW
jgi:hypothetical protein